MKREHQKAISDMYENDFVKEGKFGKETTDSQTKNIQSSELTGSDGVKIWSYRAAAVCFLLTAVIVLYITFIQERRQILTKITSLTEERDQLLTKIMNLTEERDLLKLEKSELQKCFPGGWKCHQSSFYFLSSEKKTWSESRRYCTERGADLIIINNREEQGFVKNMSVGDLVWIGLTDIDVEGRWIWVDGSNVISGFWAPGEPNYSEEDCALNHSPGWADYPCTYSYKWICEKSIFN